MNKLITAQENMCILRFILRNTFHAHKFVVTFFTIIDRNIFLFNFILYLYKYDFPAA
jgi:hypothetical protein